MFSSLRLHGVHAPTRMFPAVQLMPASRSTAVTAQSVLGCVFYFSIEARHDRKSKSRKAWALRRPRRSRFLPCMDGYQNNYRVRNVNMLNVRVPVAYVRCAGGNRLLQTTPALLHTIHLLLLAVTSRCCSATLSVESAGRSFGK